MPKLKPTPFAIALIAAAVLVAGGAAFFFSKSQAKGDTPPTAKPALTVATALPRQMTLPVRLNANGNITAWQEAVIGSESNGLRLVQVQANVGDQVKAGQVLAVFSGDSVLADTAQARASLIEAQANAADAADNAARARTLASSGALSDQQINQYNTAEQTAKARVEAAKAVLDAQQLRGKNTQVLAPDSGVISARTATVGSVVPQGTELFRLIRGGRLEWRAEVTSAELGRIKAGTTARVVAASGAELKGRVRMIAPSVDPQTRAALVYVDLPVSAGMASPAKAGMFARGEFELGETPALTVPQPALVVRDGFNYLFRLNADNRVSQLKVQTGRLAGDRVEITSGLAADARIIVNGAGFLNDGDLVRVSDAVPAAPATARPATAASK
ncbi:efflux RND transporter periplasmic adaptor subunit [Polaromonas sp. CF318]|uniref:efflux RND transporter periplasmic adaptor subunit n=1 Tax=Polaromonas sp. CF318 TaxID=1144318 RepID=UPI0003154476|nr:efflux RND transporter periplasmic adaptor subunit [Polaromonas sp. CF318]